MAIEFPFNVDSDARLVSEADRIEKVASFLSRADSRAHLLERAAAYRAMVALVSLGAPRETTNGGGAS